jgi:nucleotide sugar dehydrogenase
MKIGIIGKGFVGSAVKFGFSPNVGCDAETKVFDVDPQKSTHSLNEVVNDSDFVFISVPTPSDKNGKIDLSILENCIENISKIATNDSTIFLIRSTIVPGTSSALQEKFPNIKLVFNPEFLTERSANYDFINQSRFILGGDATDVSKVSELYKWRFGKTISIIETNFETAELIKYMTNTFLATKVSFLNEIRILSDKVGANWEDAVEGFVRDGRVGHSHLNVPGPDGKFGFGGSCFPKDIQALISFADHEDVDLNVLKGAWKTNLKVRPEKDWEKLEGRAISKNRN